MSRGQAEVHNALGVGYQYLGQLDNAAESLGTAAEIRERIGDKRGLATSLLNLSMIELTQGHTEIAEKHLTKALGIHEELGNRVGIAETQNALGVLEERRGRYRESLDAYRQALQISKDLGDEWMLARELLECGIQPLPSRRVRRRGTLLGRSARSSTNRTRNLGVPSRLCSRLASARKPRGNGRMRRDRFLRL